ncbi:hypothetical protein BT93_D0865 [Corymbia citriodora subsp. variegata]|nr:hypothetical protein BT93_D0865 [Corymbia citriodora subsp. variegata]
MNPVAATSSQSKESSATGITIIPLLRTAKYMVTRLCSQICLIRISLMILGLGKTFLFSTATSGTTVPCRRRLQ